MQSGLRTLLMLMLFCFSMGKAYAQDSQGMVEKDALLKLYMEEVNLTDMESLGWLGSSYLLEAFPNVFFGASMYGAVTGKRGGFFSLGPEVLWRNQFGDHWFVDMGLYIGGGGGGSANQLVKGGLMLRPHLDISYQISDYQLGLSASHVRFPYGTISSNQIGLALSIPHDFYHNSTANGDDVSHMDGGLGFHRIRGIASFYRGDLFGRNTQDSTVMLGARADQWISEQTFWSLEIVGAAGGNMGGYAEYLLGVGVTYPALDGVIDVGSRIAMGMGGGGGAATKGGALAKAAVFTEIQLTSDIHIALEGGYMGALQGDMHAQYVSAELVLNLDNPHANAYHIIQSDYEWQVGVFNYHTVIPTGQTDSVPLTASEMVMNRFMDEHWYHGVHMMYAAKGGSYGGYGAAFISLGYQQEISDDVAVSLEVAAGGGGGGSASVGGGALYMVHGYMDYAFTPSVGLRLGVGRLKAVEGALDTMTSTLMFTYAYTVEERRTN